MQISKEHVIEVSRQHGDAHRVGDAERTLPDAVDVDLDTDLFERFGLDRGTIRRLAEESGRP